jgi:hypothetical protein
MKKYKSQFMESYIQELWKSIKELSYILKQKGIHFTFIGGAARNQYKYEVTTADLDILVSKKDFEKMKDLPIGFIREISKGRAKSFQLHDPKTKVDVIYTGEISGDGVNGLKYPDPEKISKNIKGEPFITLKNLIMYKLSSGLYGKRYKDFGDIQGLIKANKLSKDYAKDFRKDLKDKYIELWLDTYLKNEYIL